VREQGLTGLWPGGGALVGMVHLRALPGAPAWEGSMARVLDQAVADAEALAAAGFDGLMVENYSDIPFFRGPVPPETVAALTAAVGAVRSATMLPVGVNVLRNDAAAALAVAVATGARFIRVNVHTGSMWTDQGLVEGCAAETLRARMTLGADIALLADVHVKHATPPAGARLEESAADAWHRGRADALIVTGPGTGSETRLADVEAVRSRLPGAHVLVGSGTTVDNVRDVLAAADGAIVGSALMSGGKAGAGVDRDRARALVDAARAGATSAGRR
jgi:uncharacterized protein